MLSTHHSTENSTQSTNFTCVSRPGPRTRGATIAAAAEMAVADGHAEPAEYRSLLAFLRQDQMLLAFGRTAATSLFAAEIDRASRRRAVSPPAESDTVDRWQDLTDSLRPLSGMAAAKLIAAAAAHVAAADGVVSRDEVELLRAVHAALGLNEVAAVDARGQPAASPW